MRGTQRPDQRGAVDMTESRDQRGRLTAADRREQRFYRRLGYDGFIQKFVHSVVLSVRKRPNGRVLTIPTLSEYFFKISFFTVQIHRFSDIALGDPRGGVGSVGKRLLDHLFIRVGEA